MFTPRLRPAGRALIVDEDDSLLLCRFHLPPTVVRAAHFTPRGSLANGDAAFSPRDLGALIGPILAGELPKQTVAPGV